ncbi:MAG: hypothetical protein ABWZ26_04420 [Candidatus Nanopelagicales bacterium]
MYNTIDDRAGQLATRPNEHRPLNQLLFDTAVDLIRAGITIDPEQTRPLRTEIAVTVAAETLTGVSDRPVELAGLGTVPAGTLATWSPAPPSAGRSSRRETRCRPAGWPASPKPGIDPPGSCAAGCARATRSASSLAAPHPRTTATSTTSSRGRRVTPASRA